MSLPKPYLESGLKRANEVYIFGHAVSHLTTEELQAVAANSLYHLKVAAETAKEYSYVTNTVEKTEPKNRVGVMVVLVYALAVLAAVNIIAVILQFYFLPPIK